jgi:CHAD domain-containing protein
LLRTSTRRLLAMLDVARAVESNRGIRTTRRRLRHLLNATGAARDARVQLKLFGELAPSASTKGASQVRQHLRKRTHRLEHALGKLLKPYERKLPSGCPALPAALRKGTAFDRAAQRELRRARNRIRRRFRAMQAGVAGAHHRTRIALKRYRYLLEALPEISGAAPAEIAGLQVAQQRMGDLRDHDLCLHRLEKFSARHAEAQDWLKRRRPHLQARERRLRKQQPACGTKKWRFFGKGRTAAAGVPEYVA